MIKILLFLLFSFTGIRADDTTPVAAVDSGWPGCYGTGGNAEKIKIGAPMFLCLHIGSGLDWSEGIKYIRLSFSPKADEYSRLHIPNCK